MFRLWIQDAVHWFEVTGGARYLKRALLILALLGLILSYNARDFKNMSSPEAMDSAQLARNLAEGRGYTTLFVRPFSVYLLQRAYEEKHGLPPLDDTSDRAQLHTAHPDLANPPVYPFLLAGVMKFLPGVRYQAAGQSTLNFGKMKFHVWERRGSFSIYPPDFYISLLNQGLLLGMALMVFILARRLFDGPVAWTSVCIFIGTDLFWRFSIAGLSTILLMTIFLGLAWCLMHLEQGTRERAMKPPRQLMWAALAGALVGVGCLTRYSFGWLIIPVIVFIILFLGERRVQLWLAALLVATLVVSPWLLRNYRLSYTLFGTAGYAVYEAIPSTFPGYKLERSLAPELSRMALNQVWNKLVTNSTAILQDSMPRLGGTWLFTFFLAGLLIRFQSPTRGRLRVFLVLCLPVLVVAQALTRTQLSEDSPVINSENLLILLSPLVIVYGVSLFYILLDQMAPVTPNPVEPLAQVAPEQFQLRYLLIGGFGAFTCLPSLLNLVALHSTAVAYPPYYPPIIQKVSLSMRENELMMSDVPWAVAWYGRRQCMWLTLNAQSEFFAVSDYMKEVNALYLTPVTMDAHFLSDWVKAGDQSWGNLALHSMLSNELPPYFPLKHAPTGFLPDQLFLTDTLRWKTPGNSPSAR
jgi:hypothetical protein